MVRPLGDRSQAQKHSITCNPSLVVATGWIASIIVHSILIANGETREACKKGSPLKDVVHEWIAKHQSLARWSFELIDGDIAIFMLTAGLIMAFIFHYQRQLLLRRYLALHAAMSLVRGLLIWVTTIPSPSPNCRNFERDSDLIVPRAAALTVAAVGIDVKHALQLIGVGQISIEKITGQTCCDIVVSGHASTIAINAWMFLSTAVFIKPGWIRAVAYVGVLMALMNTMLPHKHYTIDGFHLKAQPWLVKMVEGGDDPIRPIHVDFSWVVYKSILRRILSKKLANGSDDKTECNDIKLNFQKPDTSDSSKEA